MIYFAVQYKIKILSWKGLNKTAYCLFFMKKKEECCICGKSIVSESEVIDGVTVWSRNVCGNPKCDKLFDEFLESPDPKTCCKCGVKLTEDDHITLTPKTGKKEGFCDKCAQKD